MRGIYNFVVTPLGDRYNNKKKIGDSELILNTEVFNHQFINREAKVISTPIIGDTNIIPGDTVILHHNVFRRWHNIRGEEKNSRSYFKENTYLVNHDQIFLYKRDNDWKAPKEYCFVQPIENTDIFSLDKEKPLIGIVKYSSIYKEGDIVGFCPSSEYEFVINGDRLYRVLSNLITMKYEYQGNEKAYNPSWAQSS